MSLLEANNISFAYSAGAPVLRDVSVQLAAGEVVALIGPNGSGKSTLIKVLLGNLRGGGGVAWDGVPMSRWSRRKLARLVAYMPQFPAYESDHTVADVLRLGRAPYLRAFGLESSRDIDVIHDVARLLDMEQFLPRRMDQLSGGQRQRVFVGRCLVQEPRALLLDEPNAFLDLRHQVELSRLLRTLARGQSLGVLLALHDLNLAAMFADRLILLDGGQVAAAGPPAAVLDPALLTRTYGIPMKRIDTPGSGPPIVVPDTAL